MTSWYQGSPDRFSCRAGACFGHRTLGLSISFGGEVLVLRNLPSPMYSYWENGRNLFLYSDLCSLMLSCYSDLLILTRLTLFWEQGSDCEGWCRLDRQQSLNDTTLELALQMVHYTTKILATMQTSSLQGQSCRIGTMRNGGTLQKYIFKTK